MIKFKAIRENITEALKNPYKGKPERDLKRKLASFETQLADLIKKSRFRQRKDIEGEIQDMETKVQQVRAALKEDVNEAFSSFAVPVPSQTLNGKKIGGGKTPIIVKARTAREAIQKAAKQLGVDFKFLKTGKVVKEGLEESIDEAGPTYIDGVKYQKEKKKKGFNKDDWEWNSSKQLYKKVKEDVQEAVELDEAFLRLPGEMINGELPMAIRDLESILKGLKAGNDFDAKGFNKQMARLTAVKKAAKKFNSEDEVPTRYNYTAKK